MMSFLMFLLFLLIITIEFIVILKSSYKPTPMMLYSTIYMSCMALVGYTYNHVSMYYNGFMFWLWILAVVFIVIFTIIYPFPKKETLI